jgi:hypothetical protein
VALTGPFVIDQRHPLAEGLALQGVIWSAATNMSVSPGAVPVVLAGNTPLVLAQEDALGRQRLTLNLDPGLSTVHNTPDWPILFWNLLQWRASEQPGLTENNLRLGADVSLKTAGQPVRVVWPDGSHHVFAATSDRLLLETPMPGHYSVSLGSVTNRFVVNSLSTDESSLADCATGHWGAWGNESERRVEIASAVWAFGLAALAIMTLHLVLLSKPRRGAA